MIEAVAKNVKHNSYGFIFHNGKRIFLHRNSGAFRYMNFEEGLLITFREKDIQKTDKGYNLTSFREGWTRYCLKNSSNNNSLPYDVRYYLGGDYYKSIDLYYLDDLKKYTNLEKMTRDEFNAKNFEIALSMKKETEISYMGQKAKAYYFLSDVKLQQTKLDLFQQISGEVVRKCSSLKFCGKELFLVQMQVENFPDVNKMKQDFEEYQKSLKDKKSNKDDFDMTFQFTYDIHGEND